MFAAEYAARALDEDPEQAEFGVGQRHHEAIVGDQLAQDAVQAPVVEADVGALFGAVIAHPAQNGLDACHQFPWFERFGHVVVGAQFQADDAVGGLAAGGEHQDRDVRFGAQPAAQRQAVFAGQHQVEDHHVEMLGLQRLTHGRAVGDAAGVDVEAGQVVDHQLTDRHVIVDDQRADAPALVVFMLISHGRLGVVHGAVHLPVGRQPQRWAARWWFQHRRPAVRREVLM